ncbi:MAG TPA: hypothetical protein VFH70_03895, partial [Acidimicrobiales bacterium]|nr:hypothetical protein [Acidimicrobiales bacterium]
ELTATPADVLFIDDSPVNVDVAASCGLRAELLEPGDDLAALVGRHVGAARALRRSELTPG